jgi:wobble nucleotide-excising tRNase
MATERDSLEIHVDLCELRYKQLDDRMTRIESKVQEVTIDVQDLKEEMRKGFGEVKVMLQAAKDEKFKTIIASGGSVVVGLLALLGYMITHIK